MSIEHFVEEVQVLGRDLVDRVKALIHEGNVNRIIIKDDKGQRASGSRASSEQSTVETRC